MSNNFPFWRHNNIEKKTFSYGSAAIQQQLAKIIEGLLNECFSNSQIENQQAIINSIKEKVVSSYQEIVAATNLLALERWAYKKAYSLIKTELDPNGEYQSNAVVYDEKFRPLANLESQIDRLVYKAPGEERPIEKLAI